MAKQGRLLNEGADLVDAGVLRMTLDDEVAGINAAKLRKAHAILESGRSIGKHVLTRF